MRRWADEPKASGAWGVNAEQSGRPKGVSVRVSGSPEAERGEPVIRQFISPLLVNSLRTEQNH